MSNDAFKELEALVDDAATESDALYVLRRIGDTWLLRDEENRLLRRLGQKDAGAGREGVGRGAVWLWGAGIDAYRGRTGAPLPQGSDRAGHGAERETGS